MKRQIWSIKIVMRYTLLQVGGTAALIVFLIVIRRWVNIPTWLIWAIVIVWIVKDAALFPLVWRAYDWDHSNASDSIIGERGVAKERLAPSGYIQIRGELWRSEVINGSEPVEVGDAVKVVKVEGLRLFVRPEKYAN